MCMFSRNIEKLSNTRIFARREETRQFLVYEMNLESLHEVTMVLPVPIPPGSDESAVTFIDLSDYPEFFQQLHLCFPLCRGGQSLAVSQVGSFIASVVPNLADFSRLDARFRLPDTVWEKLPQYRDYGFVVFQFREGATRNHPMAFSFESRDPERMFFPTVHVHDGEVHPHGDFDHYLFLQRATPPSQWDGHWWGEQSRPFSEVMKLKGHSGEDRTFGIFDPASKAYRLPLRGPLPNVDVWV